VAGAGIGHARCEQQGAMSDYPTSKEIKGQKLPYPASQADMNRQPDSDLSNYKPAGKLEGKVALVTGADSGIGRAVAIAFCMEGAQVAILYNENDGDAETTKQMCADKGGQCLVIKADIRVPRDCKGAVEQTVAAYGNLNILVNNAAFQASHQNFADIPEEDLRRTVETNIFGMFWMTQAALKHLKDGDSIINTGSIVGKTGQEILVDYATTKGGIHAFTRSLATQLGPKNIRVNAVVPGPVWTPNIPATMPKSEVENFGHEVALARPGQPEELAPAYVLLASSDGSFMTGALVDVTGGKMSSDG